MNRWPTFTSLLLALAALLAPADGSAHALLHEIVDGETVVVKLSFPSGDLPLFESYEIFAAGAETPFQVGRVNALGEVSFRPDRPGEWRVKVFTADGHGTVVKLVVDEVMAAAVTATTQAGHSHGYAGRVVAGLGYLLGLFGIWGLWRARRHATG